MQIEFGNAGEVPTEGSGWIVGYGDWLCGLSAAADGALRYMAANAPARGVQVKWMVHPAGDDRGGAKPLSQGRTISILVSESGRFHLEFSRDPAFQQADLTRHTLSRHGDFVIWGDGLYHRWFVDETCTVLTVRWQPV